MMKRIHTEGIQAIESRLRRERDSFNLSLLPFMSGTVSRAYIDSFMEIHPLRTLEANVREGTFAAAAARLDLSQSSLSHIIGKGTASPIVTLGRMCDSSSGAKRRRPDPL
jgi:hypothetical protein